jgi:hypothetical protein
MLVDGGWAVLRALPTEHGPWWTAAPTFIRRSRFGAWERLLAMAQARGTVFLDSTSVRAHHKAAGAARRGDLKLSEIIVSAWTVSWRFWHQGLRDRRRSWPSHRVPDRARTGA